MAKIENSSRPRLVSDVEKMETWVLMLGAALGASLGATGRDGTHPPTANGLAKLLAATVLAWPATDNYPPQPGPRSTRRSEATALASVPSSSLPTC